MRPAPGEGLTVLSPNGRRIAIAQGTRLRVYDVQEPKLRLRYAAEASATITALDFSADATLLLSGSRDGVVAVWEVERYAKPTYTFRLHGDRTRAVLWSDTEGLFASAGEDGVLVLYGIDGKAHQRYENGPPLRTVALTLGSCLLTGDVEGSIRLWTPFDGEPIEKKHVDDAVVRVLASADLLACTTEGGELHVWKGDERLFHRRFPTAPSALRFHARHPERLGVAEARRLEIFSVTGGEARLQHRVDASFSIVDFAWSKEGDLVLLGFEGGRLIVACGAATLRVPFEIVAPVD